MPNRLARETSPYLIQHSNNPVDWHAWNDEAFVLAKQLDKPVLLSIGYSSCHWCHVMEQESFENEEIASLMNENFVCIKVDREERPDVDSVYMSAVQAMTGHGGWPLTVFLTPERRPFFGGTYYPSEPRGGMPGFPQILEAISDAYFNRRADLETTSQHVIEHIQGRIEDPSVGIQFNMERLNDAYTNLKQQYDWALGGFGAPIKFPQPFVHEFLLRYYASYPDSMALQIVEKSLKSMACGGIYDQIGGGFHRYSTTADWLTPHFEKMLYDNALLARLYFHAFQITRDDFYKFVGIDILNYISRDMASQDGLFYSASDADSEGAEGAYFIWSLDEVCSVLETDQDSQFLQDFDITEDGNFEGKNIFHFTSKQNDHPFFKKKDGPQAHYRKKLLEERYKKEAPFRDEKIIFSWNALMGQAFLDGYAATGDIQFLDKAILNIKSLMKLKKEFGGIFRSWKDGKFSGYGYLEDYANFINLLINAHALTSNPNYLLDAQVLADGMVLKFWDQSNRTFYDTPIDGEELIYRPNELYDNAVPSGSSSASDSLRKLAIIFDNDEYRDIVKFTERTVFNNSLEHPTAFGNWLTGFWDGLVGMNEIVIIGETNSDINILRNILLKEYVPNSVMVCEAQGDYRGDVFEKIHSTPLLKERDLLAGKSTVYICKNYTCELPVNNTEDLKNLLKHHKEI